MNMVEVDASRLKWELIDIVQDFFEAHFSKDAESRLEQFKEEFDKLLESDKIATFGVQHLIKSFRPALAVVLEPVLFLILHYLELNITTFNLHWMNKKRREFVRFLKVE
jgi:hypothetical protein